MKNFKITCRNTEAVKSFQLLLLFFFIAIVTYTLIATKNQGWNLIAVFIGNLTALEWSGQFNLDFTTYLWLSGLWIAWRVNFSTKGIILGLIASVLGMLFFAPYLLVLLNKENNDLKAVILGKRNN